MAQDNTNNEITLDFPLTTKNQTIIKAGMFALGTVTLVSGSASVTHTSIRTKSVAFVSYNTTAGTTGTLSAQITDKTLTVTSSSGTDTSTVFYCVIF